MPIGSAPLRPLRILRSEEHTFELQSHSEISYAVFCLKKKKKHYGQIFSIIVGISRNKQFCGRVSCSAGVILQVQNFFFLRIRWPPRSTLILTIFPYTTLFRSISCLTSLLPVCLHTAFRFIISEAAYRSEEHTSELQSHSEISYAVFCWKKKKTTINKTETHTDNTKITITTTI